MSKNKWLFSFIPVIALLFFVLLLQWKNRPVKNFWVENKQVDSFCVNTLCLKKNNTNWEISDQNTTQPADGQAVDDFVTKLAELELSAVASSNSKRFEELGVRANSPVVQVGDKKLVIGALGPTFDTTYVKPTDQEVVYEISGIWGNGEVAKLEFWKVKYLVNESIFQLKKITIQSDKITKDYEPKDEKWENEKAASAASYVRVGKYIGQKAPDLTSDKYFVTLTTDNGEVKYGFGKSIQGKTSTYWAMKDGAVYEIQESDFKTLTTLL